MELFSFQRRLSPYTEKAGGLQLFKIAFPFLATLLVGNEQIPNGPLLKDVDLAALVLFQVRSENDPCTKSFGFCFM